MPRDSRFSIGDRVAFTNNCGHILYDGPEWAEWARFASGVVVAIHENLVSVEFDSPFIYDDVVDYDGNDDPIYETVYHTLSNYRYVELELIRPGHRLYSSTTSRQKYAHTTLEVI